VLQVDLREGTSTNRYAFLLSFGLTRYLAQRYLANFIATIKPKKTIMTSITQSSSSCRVIHESLRIFELGNATTKTDTTERSILISREFLQTWSVSPSVDTLVTFTAALPQSSEIPEELMNYPVPFL
jgi:hypothetical protein